MHVPPKRWPIPPSTIQLPWFLRSIPNNVIVDLGWVDLTVVEKQDGHPEVRIERLVNLNCQQPPEVNQAVLKTVYRYSIRMGRGGSLGLKSDVLITVGNDLVPSCQCPPDSLAAYIDGVWDWTIRFVCRVCGKSYYCECFRTALEKHYLKALEEKNHYAGSRTDKFITAYQKSQFREGICHLCRDIPSEIFYCHPMYGSKVKVHYGPYIKRIAIAKDIDEHEAENEVRDLLGIPHIGEGWVSERELLNMVKDIFPEHKTVHQASPEWLGRQRLDIFIPELLLAIEYQGLQHYEPIPFFGGEKSLLQTQERDKLKAKLCAENSVKLVYFRYDESITPKLVREKLRKALQT